jgi:hypothetical protein
MFSTQSGGDPTLSPIPDRAADAPDRPPAEYLPAAPPGITLIRPLGHGGMGSVYLAHEVAAERTVAIKFLHAPGSPNAYDRFLVEVRALARLDAHPNVVRVYAVVTEWREPYFTMEYVAGGTLADLVSTDRPLPDPADAARLILGAAAGVAAAHAAGIWHRDLKPSNVLLQIPDARLKIDGPEAAAASSQSPIVNLQSATPKVSDFGLAKRTDHDDGLTRTGPIGTPGYMSPEAADGRFRQVGPASDVYGLGATLYYLLTGRAPFSGREAAEVIRRVVTDVPERPRAVRPEVPAELEAVVVRAMEKAPAERYATVEGFADDLRRVLAGLKPVAPVLTRWRRAWRWLVHNRKRVATTVAAVLLVAGFAAAVWVALPARDPAEVIRAELARGKRVALIDRQGRPLKPAWPLGPEELHGTPADGGTCSFRSRDGRILLLLDDPGIDRYRLRAEIRQEGKIREAVPEPNKPSYNTVGLVLGYVQQKGVGDTEAHAMTVVWYSDFDHPKEVNPARKLRLEHAAVVTSPFRPGVILPKRGNSTPLDPPGADGPPWREIVVDVTPDGFRATCSTGSMVYSAADVARRRGDLQSTLANSRAAITAPPPPWAPRMPLGIWCYGSLVSVRNVTIEPLE